MTTMTGETSTVATGLGSKRVWRRPEVREVGYLRDFIRCGNAEGKSGITIDGSSCGTDEAMGH
jgi:hypothetical protein